MWQSIKAAALTVLLIAILLTCLALAPVIAVTIGALTAIAGVIFLIVVVFIGIKTGLEEDSNLKD
jgi:membrane associated rhomboid family serine protease